MNFAVTPLSRQAIRELANRIRKIAGGPDYFNILEFIELILPQIDSEFQGLEVVEDKDLLDCYAKAYPDEGRIVVKNSVYENAEKGIGRDRFTLTHELAHYILHSSSRVEYARHGTGKIPSYCNPEWQANTFAGELLVPVDIAKTHTVEEIKKCCGVSYTVAEIQKKEATKRL